MTIAYIRVIDTAYNDIFIESVSENSRTVIAVTASVKEDETAGQGHPFERLLHHSVT
jgi:hypothetical protein